MQLQCKYNHIWDQNKPYVIDLQLPILFMQLHLTFFKIQQSEMNFFSVKMTTIVYAISSDW